jgi:hypothetical protein
MKHFVKAEPGVGAGISYSRGERHKRKESEDYIAGPHAAAIDPFLNVGDQKKVVVKRGCKTGLPHVRHIDFQGLPVDVELDVGMVAEGKEPDGKPWRVEYRHPYGEIRRTEGEDGDAVDVYVGPCSQSQKVFIVHQVKKDGSYDEDKCFLGFDSPQEATRCYFEHGPQWGFGSLESMTFNEFRYGYLASNRKNGYEKSLVLDLKASFKE